ncbi:MAG TPA: alpha/beta hydrolase-fold protein [Rhodothermia bacterium]
MSVVDAKPAFRGRLVRHLNFSSEHVESRNVDVWLPEGYDRQKDRTYSVVYLHDGQNLFDPALSFSGIDWGIHESLSLLQDEGRIRDTIAVGIWNTPKRLLRYMPKRPFDLARDSTYINLWLEEHGNAPASDRYIEFIVSELKPFIDDQYRVRPEAADTFIMGASMGALVSLYALCEYPDVFGGAGCLSTSWTVAGDIFMPYLEQQLPPPGRHRFYFDYGQEALIKGYTKLQERATKIAIRAGYSEGVDWIVHEFPDHDHSERAWRERVAVPLELLLSLPEPV